MAEEDCEEYPEALKGGITKKGPFEIHKGNNYSPQGVGGWRPDEGDTHGSNLLNVPDCSE